MVNRAKIPRWLRISLPLVAVILWFSMSGIGGPYFGRIDEVASNDQTTFLPKSAESTRVNGQLSAYQSSETLPAIIVFEKPQPFTTADKETISQARDILQQTSVVKGIISPPIMSDDGRGSLLIVPTDSKREQAQVVDQLKDALKKHDIRLTYAFTGPAVFIKDLSEAFSGIDGTLLLVALGVVFIILLIVYRSPLLPLITLMGSIFALSAAILVVWHLAKAGVIQLNGQVQGILFILVIGAATDYSLLYIARFREELTRHRDTWQASVAAWKATWEPVVAAAGTVTLGLLCLLASDLGSNKALGPVGGIGVLFAMLSSLTFLPAALLLLGRRAFWPRRPDVADRGAQRDYHVNHPTWSKFGTFVGRYPRRLWVGLISLLAVMCLGLFQLNAQGVSQADLIIGKSEARDGQALLEKHFPRGSGSPAYVLTPKDKQDAVISLLEADKGVETISIVTTDGTKSPAPVGRSAVAVKQAIRDTIATSQAETLASLRAQIAESMMGAPQASVDQAYQVAAMQLPSVDTLTELAYPFAASTPKVVDGQVLVQAVLADPADSVAARSTIERLRNAVQTQGLEAKFGGVSAIQLDTNIASRHDQRTVLPLILIAITIVLILLLRSLVAPLILLVTTVISFGATLGMSALLFNHLWHYPGADPSVIVFGFVFLVALGIDYNIFLMTRVREETAQLGVRKGTIKGVVVTGGVITSAGVVLAATFAALYVLPILFLAQIAFIVAFGVLLDTIIVRSLIVPGLTLDIGKIMWWPSRLANNSKKES